jgi:hypothetical protein
MWNMKCLVIPVLMGAMGFVNKVLRTSGKKYQESIQ